MLCCQRITGRLIGCYIWGYIWRINPHGEGGGRGKNDFAGMVEAVRVGVVWWWCRWWWCGCGCWCSGVARLQGGEVARLRVERHSQSIFALVLLWFDVGIIDYFCTIGGLYRFGDGGGRAGWLVGGGGLVGWWCRWWGGTGRRYPPLHLYSWNDKGVWNAEIFF